MINKYFSKILILIITFLLLYTFYKSEIIYEGTRRYYYFYYYSLLSFLLVLSFLSIKFNETIKTYLTIIGFSLIFTFYISELYLIFVDNPQVRLINNRAKVYKELSNKEYDRRSKYKIFKEKIVEDKDIKILTSPRTYQLENENYLLPLAGVSNSNTIFCNENGYYSSYLSDRYGFNNPDYVWDKKNKTYVLVGDSYLHGACVNRPNDIASVMRKNSSENIINLGFSSAGPLTELALLKEYSPSHASKVIWFYYEGNDLIDLNTELRNHLVIQKYFDAQFTQNLKNRQKIIDKHKNQDLKNLDKEYKSDLIFKIKNFFKLSTLRSKILKFKHKDTNKKEKLKNFSKFKEILFLAHEYSRKENSDFYFVYLPEYKRYISEYDDDLYIQIKNTTSELGIEMIDIHKEIFENRDALKYFPFRLSGHYNADAYKDIANLIIEKLTK